MYGIVNRGVEQMLVARFGEELWRQVVDEVDPQWVGFVSMESYPDELTYRLIEAASRRTGTGRAELLEAWGEQWFLPVFEEGFGHLIDMTGESLGEVLSRLDALYARVALLFPQMRAPGFVCKTLGPGLWELLYRSEREGLAPLAKGSLRGLAARLGTRVEVEQVAARPEAEHDVFRVREVGS